MWDPHGCGISDGLIRPLGLEGRFALCLRLPLRQLPGSNFAELKNGGWWFPLTSSPAWRNHAQTIFGNCIHSTQETEVFALSNTERILLGVKVHVYSGALWGEQWVFFLP